jgi:hypothetical protein
MCGLLTVGGGYAAQVNSVTPLDLDVAVLLDWGSRHGDPLDPRAAEAVVGLLALSGARRRTGLPEPSAELVKELMLVLLPLYVSADPADLAGYPAVLVALIGYTHAEGKLNARRRDRLIAEVETLRPQFESAMTSRRRVTWARLYGQMLRAEGVDAADPRAVGAWVDALAGRPYPQRRAALGLAASGGSDARESGGVSPLASAAFVRALTGERSRQARLLLAQRLESVVLREQLAGHDGAPLVAEAPQDMEDQEVAGSWYDAEAGFLADRWTAAGLDALLRGQAARLAPGLDRPAPLLSVVEELAVTHLEMFGSGVVPLAPAPLPAAAHELCAAVRAAPLPASLAATVADPDHADTRLLDLALASGFLRRGAEGPLLPGAAAEIWEDGTPAELAGLALDMLGALLAQLARDEETAEEFPGENLLLLYSLYERAGIPQSLAWQAAVDSEWILSPETGAAPDVSVTADGPYQLPDVPVLAQLTGIPGLTEDDRDELEPAALRLARVVDQLAGLGITTRAGDAIALTPLGSALVRDALIVGTTELDENAAASFPTQDEVLSWDARHLAGAVGNWPEVAARQVLREWLTARGPAGWGTLLPALSTQVSDGAAVAGPGLMRLVELGAAPAEVLRGAVPDGVIGAFAERALRLRGLPPGDEGVPASARAVLIACELEQVSRVAFLAHRTAGADPGSDPWLPPELKEAFDHAADGWPGGAAALLAALAGAMPGTFKLLAGPLSQHPDPDVARAARRARLAAQAAVTAPHRKKKARSESARPRKGGRRRHR